MRVIPKSILLFMDAGAPSDPPDGNMEMKCIAWLKRYNEDENLNPLRVLGLVIQKLMGANPEMDERIRMAQERITECLAKNRLGHQLNGLLP